MFLASFNSLGPIASVFLFVVKQTADTELFGSGRVPAGPVTDAGRFVSEDAVLPVARSYTDGRVCKFGWWNPLVIILGWNDMKIKVKLTGQLFVLARVTSPRVVAVLQETAGTSGENQAVGAVELLGDAIDTLPVSVTIGYIGSHFALSLARIGLWSFQCLGHR